jgi:hypothetical protein
MAVVVDRRRALLWWRPDIVVAWSGLGLGLWRWWRGWRGRRRAFVVLIMVMVTVKVLPTRPEMLRAIPLGVLGDLVEKDRDDGGADEKDAVAPKAEHGDGGRRERQAVEGLA